MQSFVHDTNPGRVVFGAGSAARIGEEVARLGCERALVVCTPGRAAMAGAATEGLGARRAGLHAQARMHVPIETAVAGRAAAREVDADCIVTVGGGSSIGLGKAIVLDCDIPLLCIVTTYSGSEMTSGCGMVENGRKVMHKSPRMLPCTVIYDAELTLDLPPAIAGPSGINAVAHAVEALYCADRNPMKSLISLDGIRAMARALPAIADKPDDLAARGEALYGAWCCGIAAGSGARALHHKLAHVVGGSFDMPHAETHTILLPHAMAYNAAVAPEAMEAIADALGASGENAAQALFDLSGRIGAPRALRDIGMPEDGLDRAADETLINPYPNPRELDRAAIRALLGNAWRGDAPV